MLPETGAGGGPALKISSGGAATAQRQRCDEQDDADVFIDAQRPLIIAILDWAKATHLAAERASGSKLPRQIVFDTTNRTYFGTVKSTLARHGWQVVDRPATTDRATHGRTEKRALEVRRQLPRLLTPTRRRRLHLHRHLSPPPRLPRSPREGTSRPTRRRPSRRTPRVA